jgi:5-methylcytosine-specific restriction endonuclease McrA
MASAKHVLPFYVGPDWKALMRQIIKQRGRCCQDPRHDGAYPRQGVRLLGDHIVELRDGGARLDPRNVMLRCYRCHGRKTNEEKCKREAMKIGVDGMPLGDHAWSTGGGVKSKEAAQATAI